MKLEAGGFRVADRVQGKVVIIVTEATSGSQLRADFL
jgi:hypothetical protein